MRTADFLCELLTEEMPARCLPVFSDSLRANCRSALQAAGLAYAHLAVFVTPRRLALLIRELAAEQPEQSINKRGPALQAAFDATGEPTAAAQGFAKSCGVSVTELTRVTTAKGVFLAYQRTVAGRPTAELMPGIVERVIQQLPLPKVMRWGTGQYAFIRPVHNLVMLFGSQVLAAELFGCRASNTTRGHLFHHPETLEIPSASDYVAVLKQPGFVMVDFAERRRAIQQQVTEIAAAEGLQAVIDDALLTEVTGLVEWPQAYLAHFSTSFLDVPREALMAFIQAHQKCFPCVNTADELQAHFIFVANIASQQPSRVIEGNERVMRARLSDAAFFFAKDKATSLEDRLPALNQVTFHAKLGSMFDKVQRLSQLAHCIAQHNSLAAATAARAALLCKCDLVSEMVGEFPELQGIMGYYYALASGDNETVAGAIKEHYQPRFARDDLPNTPLGHVLAIADKLDSLVGFFAVGEIPTGEKDPFATRRLALALVRLMSEAPLAGKLSDWLAQAAACYTDCTIPSTCLSEVKHFILERLRAWYLEQGYPHDVLAAVLASQDEQLHDVKRRLEAVQAFRQLPEAEALGRANKRVQKLLLKEQRVPTTPEVTSALLETPAEQALAEQIQAKQAALSSLYARGDYQEILTALAELQKPLDRFFSEVMVMVDDPKLRYNRLALLAELRQLFLGVADISLLQ